MKNIKIIAISILLGSYLTELIAANSLEKEVIMEQVSLAEQVYNRLVVSNRIVKFTNRYIDSKRQEKPNVPDNIWTQIKSNIDYSIFKNGAIEVLNNNLSSGQMQALISDFADKPSIPIPNLIKKELYDLMPSFQTATDHKISQILSDNGY